MKYDYRWGVVALVLASLQLQGCRQAPAIAAGEEEQKPAVVEHLEGDAPARVTLSAAAAKRLDIQTDSVREAQVDGTLQRVIPYAAVLYDTEGNTWTYTSSEPLVFVRRQITIDHVAGGLAVLSQGPPSGTAVVTVGVAELYGSESEFEEE